MLNKFHLKYIYMFSGIWEHHRGFLPYFSFNGNEESGSVEKIVSAMSVHLDQGKP